MAGIGNTYFDLVDLEKSKDPDGSIADVIEMLVELNPMLMDAMAVECNNGTSHRHTVRTGLPAVTWGMLYKGIPQGKSTKAQVDDTTGFVEGLSTIDERVLDLSDNEGAVRLSEAFAYLEAMSQEVQEKIIYGNSNSAPNQFMGLAPRFNDLSAVNGNQIISAGGGDAGENTSIWIVTWADHACHTVYPKGTSAGIVREDKGEQRIVDANGAYYVKEELFRQHVGLCVKDWRYVSRVANIDVADLAAGNVDIYKFLRKAYYALQSRRVPMGGKQVIYCNTDVLEALDALATNQGIGGSVGDNFTRLTRMEIQGEEVTAYRGIPIRETDALINTEDPVT